MIYIFYLVIVVIARKSMANTLFLVSPKTSGLGNYIGSVKKTDNILLYLYLFNNLWKILISALMRYIFVVHCVGERCIVKDV